MEALLARAADAAAATSTALLRARAACHESAQHPERAGLDAMETRLDEAFAALQAVKATSCDRVALSSVVPVAEDVVAIVDAALRAARQRLGIASPPREAARGAGEQESAAEAAEEASSDAENAPPAQPQLSVTSAAVAAAGAASPSTPKLSDFGLAGYGRGEAAHSASPNVARRVDFGDSPARATQPPAAASADADATGELDSLLRGAAALKTLRGAACAASAAASGAPLAIPLPPPPVAAPRPAVVAAPQPPQPAQQPPVATATDSRPSELTKAEFDALPSFVSSRLPLAELNALVRQLAAQRLGARRVSLDALASALGLGDRAQAFALALVRARRLRLVHADGATAYELA